MTAPLALTQRKITCVGVIPSRAAAFSNGLSTGPPGKVVMGLIIYPMSPFVDRMTSVKFNLRKASVCFCYNAMFCVIFEQGGIFSNVIWMKTNLGFNASEMRSCLGAILRTWLTTGLTFAIFKTFCKSLTSKLLTPMFLDRRVKTI